VQGCFAYFKDLVLCHAVKVRVFITFFCANQSDDICTFPETKLESREMWLPIVLVEIPKTHVCQTRSGTDFHHCSYGKIALMSNISKTVTDAMTGPMEVECETTLGY